MSMTSLTSSAYRDGATAALAIIHGVSLKSVKRLLHTAGVHRTLSTRRFIIAFD